MDHEISRIILALVLSGLVLFAWNYYRAAYSSRTSESVTVVQQEEKVETQKTDIRKDLSIYKNCGRLKIIVYPLYKTLEYINSKINNPGIALILFTLMIRLLLIPLTIKQIKSSKSMAGLKDEIEKIKSRYKDNPLEMQKAVGYFFKEKSINPFSSIGLAIIQIPLFVALYKIVREAHLFSGARLGLWINDLGIADPYYILPCLAGLMMYFGMRFAGNAGNQITGWLIYILPTMFTLFLLNQPSGLALYILVGSVFQLGFNAIYMREKVKISKQ